MLKKLIGANMQHRASRPQTSGIVIQKEQTEAIDLHIGVEIEKHSTT